LSRQPETYCILAAFPATASEKEEKMWLQLLRKERKKAGF
jgi:hypothetical protein